ncbi:MAG TPA: NUDIX hydrolase [Pyrinomonadaceae bacterium]|nr:NUDIX hydrolase [Pyrinomonadaceae bacterium]
MGEPILSQVGLAVIKVRIDGRPFYLMRKNPSWGDVSFVGGHLNERDDGILKRAAYRELLEEVPSLRKARGLKLNALTPQLHHGPVYSPSAKSVKVYDFQFFLVLFTHNPERALHAISERSLNLLVGERELLEPNHCKVAALVGILDSEYAGGLQAIPYSWPAEVKSLGDRIAQTTFAF